jgi:hypothetical protein
MKTKIENFEQRVLLNNYWMPLAKQEDHWDNLLRENTSLETGRSGVLWKDAIQEANSLNRATYDRMNASENAAMKKMQQIVDQERILAAKEREDRLKKAGKSIHSS